MQVLLPQKFSLTYLWVAWYPRLHGAPDPGASRNLSSYDGSPCGAQPTLGLEPLCSFGYQSCNITGGQHGGTPVHCAMRSHSDHAIHFPDHNRIHNTALSHDAGTGRSSIAKMQATKLGHTRPGGGPCESTTLRFMLAFGYWHTPSSCSSFCDIS